MSPEDDPKGPAGRRPQRFATRISGESWDALVDGLAGDVRVLRISRIGIELETETSLETGARYPIRLTHAGETTRTTFYVLRCPERRNAAGTSYRPAGLFVETLDRDDLPALIPTHPPG